MPPPAHRKIRDERGTASMLFTSGWATCQFYFISQRYSIGMKSDHFLKTAAACLVNGERLIEDAEWQPEDRPASAFALAVIAQEEIAKAFLLFLVSRNVISWSPLIFRATRDHACKQLLGLVINYLNPTWEDFESRVNEWKTHHQAWEKLFTEYQRATNNDEKRRLWQQIEELKNSKRDLPTPVADAINIFRHEKIGRWESSTWLWAEEPDYNEEANDLANGKLDAQKQDAFYVRIGKNGGLSGTPDKIMPEDVREALELSKRLGYLVKGLLDGSRVYDAEYQKIESIFKILFENPVQENS